MTTITQAHIEWLEQRGLDAELAVKMGWHSRGPRIAIPYTLNEQVKFVKLRWPERKKGMACEPSGVPQTFLWNEDALQEDPSPNEPLIITEGEPDALACLQAGYRFVVSVPSGAADSTEAAYKNALRYLAVPVEGEDDRHDVKPCVAKFDRVIVAADGDTPGIALRDALVSLLGKRVCFLPRYPERTKDSNDVLAKYGVDALRQMIEQAEPAEPDHFVGAAEAAKRTPRAVPMDIGIPFLADNIRITRPGLMVVAGTPGSGKSVITRNIVFSLMWANPMMKASIFNGEGGVHSLYDDAWKFWNRMNPHSKLDVVAKDAWINQYVGVMQPPQGEQPSLSWLLSTMELQALRRERTVFVIDPWNWVRVPTARGQTQTEAINDAIKDIYALADRLRLFVVIVTHTSPVREAWVKTEPTMAHIADSANFARRADHVLMVWKPNEADQYAKLIIAKSKRHDVNGRPGKHWITFDENSAGITKLGFDPIERAELLRQAEREKLREERKAGAKQASDGIPPIDDQLIADQLN